MQQPRLRAHDQPDVREHGRSAPEPSGEVESPRIEQCTVYEPGDEMIVYLVEYNYGGSTWGLQIHAENFEEAERKLRALKTNARIIGSSIASVPVPGLFARIASWFGKRS